MGHVTRDAEGGDVDAMIEQGNLLLEDGDLESAEAWYRRAAAGGNTGAMHNLGFVLGEKGDLTGAPGPGRPRRGQRLVPAGRGGRRPRGHGQSP